MKESFCPKSNISKKSDLSPKELQSIKFLVKRELETNHIPLLPERVEMRLFMEGQTAWNFKYSDFSVKKAKVSKRVDFIIEVLLKKEFHAHLRSRRYKFRVICRYHIETWKSKILSITRLTE